MAVKTAKKGDKVSVEYTGKLESGQVFDSSKGKEPLQFQLGSGQVIKGFDQGIEGMKVGEEKTITINPEDAYGKRNENYIKDLPKKTIPPQIELKIGNLLVFQREDGLKMPATIVEITDDIVKADFNHPLAGKKLIFSVKLVAVN